MKGITKKFLTLGLAGVMFGATAVGLAGCDNEYDVSDTENRTMLISNKNVYIVVSENGIDTLHKGNVVTYTWDVYGSGPTSLPTVLKFNCGKELQTYQFVAYPQGCPAKEKYDVVCDCAYELTLQSDSLQEESLNHKEASSSYAENNAGKEL